jgi:hypothetical protein
MVQATRGEMSTALDLRDHTQASPRGRLTAPSRAARRFRGGQVPDCALGSGVKEQSADGVLRLSLSSWWSRQSFGIPGGRIRRAGQSVQPASRQSHGLPLRPFRRPRRRRYADGPGTCARPRGLAGGRPPASRLWSSRLSPVSVTKGRDDINSIDIATARFGPNSVRLTKRWRRRHP